MITAKVKRQNAHNYSNFSYVPRMETFADRLKAAISSSGMNQSELARRCGIRSQTINRLLSGDSKLPSSPNLLKIADALGISHEWLANGKPAPLEPVLLVSGSQQSPEEDRHRSGERRLRRVPCTDGLCVKR